MDDNGYIREAASVDTNEEPNELTCKTLEMSERGEELHHAEDAEDLFKQLGI